MILGWLPVLMVSSVVEGDVDAALARRTVRFAGADVDRVFVKAGKQNLLRDLQGYARAADHGHWFVLLDLDRDADCAPQARREWLPTAHAQLCLRIAVRAAEAWLLADAENIARFLAVNSRHVPAQPEDLEDPKRALVDVARRSRRREIREGIVPREGSGRAVGAAYTALMVEFIEDVWDPEQAALRADSLRRSIDCIRAFAKAPREPG